MGQKLWLLRFAFPYDEHRPPDLLKGCDVPAVAPKVSVELFVPERLLGGRPPSPWAVVLVPEAPVNEDGLSSSGESQVGCTR